MARAAFISLKYRSMPDVNLRSELRVDTYDSAVRILFRSRWSAILFSMNLKKEGESFFSIAFFQEKRWPSESPSLCNIVDSGKQGVEIERPASKPVFRVRTKGLEPPRRETPDPKSGAATITPRARFQVQI